MKKLLIIFAIAFTLFACNSDAGEDKSSNDLVSLTGKTMGTTLTVKYVDSTQRDFSSAIDSLLIVINNSMSTYIPNSLISIFNNKDSAVRMEVDRHFYRVFMKSKEIFQTTDGAFNPAVMPLVRYWGFGGGEAPEKIDSNKVDSLLYITDFSKIDGAMVIAGNGDTTYYIRKPYGRMQLDFSAIAKGYGVDVVGELLEGKGIENYMVEIGGEVRCRGKMGGDYWKIGIEDPVKSELDDRKAMKVVKLKNKSIATSGNYRNIRVIEGKKYAHTINPKSGYPEMNELLSTSVIAATCMEADGYATAMMVMGIEKSKDIFERNDSLDGYLIFSEGEEKVEIFATPGFEENVDK